MNIKRRHYLLLIITTIILGLISRKLNAVPAYAGDLLYAVMMYWIARFFLVNNPKGKALLSAILICFGIEFLQLVDTSFLMSIRNHKFLRLIFGQGFLWTDLIAYCIGASIAWGIDTWQKQPKNTET